MATFDCQPGDVPSSCFTDLTRFVDAAALEALDDYLLSHIPHLAARATGKLSMPEGQVLYI